MNIQEFPAKFFQFFYKFGNFHNIMFRWEKSAILPKTWPASVTKFFLKGTKIGYNF